jgi:hypothetical protein
MFLQQLLTHRPYPILLDLRQRHLDHAQGAFLPPLADHHRIERTPAIEDVPTKDLAR